MKNEFMDKIMSFGQSEEAKRAAEVLMDDLTDFYKKVVDKEVDAAFLLMMAKAIMQDMTIRKVIENYYVERTEPKKVPDVEYEGGRIKHVSAAWKNEVQFNLCKREKPIELSDSRYSDIAAEMVTYLYNTIGKDLEYEES